MASQSKKLKILITTDLYTTNTNGVVTSVQNLFGELKAKGHDVRILTLSNDMHSHKDGALYYIRSLPLGVVYPDVRMPTAFHHKLIQELIDWRPDVIHSQFEFFSFQFATRILPAHRCAYRNTYHTLYAALCGYLVPASGVGNVLVLGAVPAERLKK